MFLSAVIHWSGKARHNDLHNCDLTEAKPVREVKVVKVGAGRQQQTPGGSTQDTSLNSSALSVEDIDMLTQEFDDE
jgi:hypothetical protein